MKKNYFKKSLSLILTVLMIMSCWVFVAPTEAEAALAYNTPAATEADSKTGYVKFHPKDDVDYVNMYYPSDIYIDVSEDLTSVGYKVFLDGHYGDSDKYRTLVYSTAWGGSYDRDNGVLKDKTMLNTFNNYTYSASGTNVYNAKENYSVDGTNYVINFQGASTNFSATVNLEAGTPKVGAGEYHFDADNSKSGTTSHARVCDMDKKNTWGNWGKNVSSTYIGNSNYTGDINIYIHVYDKSELNTAVTEANEIANSEYIGYVVNNTLNTLKTQRDNAANLLKTRKTTNADVKSQTESLNNAINALGFQANNAELKTKVAEAQTYLDRIKLYTDASTSDLQNAINAAKNSTLYTNPTVHIVANYANYSAAGAKAAADQASIATLIKNIDDAKNALVRKYDIGYDNLFSLTDWALNPVKTGKLGSNGTIEINADNGTIKITHDGSANGTDNNTSQQPTYYRAQVKGNTEYVLTWDTEGAGRAQIHVFYTTGDQYTYNVNSNYNSGSHWFVSNGDLPYSSDMGHHEVAFTTLPETDGLVFRFGTCNAGDSVTFSNIRLVEKSVYDAYAKNYNTVREAFAVGDTKNLSLTPVREGYVFDGWFKADGTKVTSVSGLSASDIVYARWSQNFTVTFKNEDGTVLKTQKVAPGAAATAPSNPTKAATKETEYAFDGWDKDFSNVQSDLVVTATYKNKAHTIDKNYLTGSTCTAAATYAPYCTNNCGVTWGEWVDGTWEGDVFTDAAMPALGHTYVRANPTYTVVTGSSTGKTDDDEHTIKCTELGCDATTTVKHNFQLDNANPAVTATCTVKGETYYKCACLETKTVTGTTNPENHVNTKLINVKAAACEVPGYTGDTFCNDCQKTVATGTATDALKHVYTTYTSNGDATCFADGTESALCDLCKDETKKATRTDEGSQLTHKYTTYVYNEGTAKCEVNGTETASCDHGCGTTATREAANTALEHDYTGAHKNNGDGTHSFLCKNGCGNYGATVSCADTYGAWTTDNATTHSHSCTVCGYTPAAEAHDWTEWQNVGGTGVSAGTKQTRLCTVCGRAEESDCNYVVTKDVPATCEAAQILTYQCTICKHGYTTTGAGPKGHKFEQSAGVKNHGDGTHSFYCSNNCGNYGFGTTKNTAVACSDWTYANTESGKHTATCNVCAYEKTENCSGGEATCTALAVCQYCDTAYGELADHNYNGNTYFEGVEKAKGATCTAQAEYYTYCSACNKSSKGTDKEATFAYGDLLPHTYTGNTEYIYKATEAKCGVNETYYVYCLACKASSKGSAEEATFEKAGTALTHNFDGTVVSNNNGTHTITCSNSNTTWACVETADYNCANTAELLGVVNAECLTAGYNMYQCRLCDYEWNVETDAALGHEYTVIDKANVKEAANCEHGTIYWYACKWCDAKGSEEQDTEKYTTLFVEVTAEKRAHSYQNKVDADYLAVPATCTAAAKYYPSCSYEDCKAVDKSKTFSSGSPLEHVFDKKVETYLAKEANCVDNATYYYVCSLCDTKGTTTWEKENSKSGHSLTHTEAKAADCYNAGNYEYWYCATCKKYFKDVDATEAYANQAATVIAKRSHDIVKVAYEDPTCEVDGTPAHEYCAYEDCKYTTKPADLSAYKATGHNFTGAYVCDTVMLYHSKKCANECGKTGIGNDEYKVEFNEDDVAVITGGEKCAFAYNAETKDGVHTHVNTCVCGNKTAKTYSYDETFVETVAPTCTEKGYDAYKCEDCGATWKMNEVKANGHTEVITTNNDGTHKIVCSVEGCNATIKAEEKCYGGTATCSAKAVCTACETAYGEFGDHVFLDANWEVTTSATCVDNAIETNTCSAEDCNATTTRRVANSATGHKMIADYVFEVPAGWDAPDLDENTIKEATCKADGLGIKYCQNEDCYKYETKVFTTGNEGHKWADETTEEIGNCLTGNPVYRECANCDAKQLVETKPGLHEYKEVYRESATCTENGSVKLVCNLCSDVEYVDSISYDFSVDSITIDNLTIDLADLKVKFHKWGENIIDKEATCGVSGKAHRICSVCSAEEALTIRPTGKHELRNNKGVPATCDRAGSSDYKSCINCSYMEASTVIPALGHADTDGNGKCDNCNDNMNALKADGCICHKDNGFMKFIYKILSFFWKLFKINKTCDCGAVHY